LIETNVLPLS